MPKGPANTVNSVDKDDRYRAPALDKGLDILELLSEQPGGLTRAEIVKAMGRGPSEVYRMLERLVAREYVSRSREGDRYSLTMKLFVLGHRHPPVRRLIARAMPLMDAFAMDTEQSCHLVVIDRDAAIVVAHSSPPGNWEFGIRIGSQIDLLTTGSGQVLLAFQDPLSRSELMARWEGSPRADELRGIDLELSRCREAGYRVGDSCQIAGIRDVSVPVVSPEGHALAVLTCPFIQRLDGSNHASVASVLTQLQIASQQLSLA